MLHANVHHVKVYEITPPCLPFPFRFPHCPEAAIAAAG